MILFYQVKYLLFSPDYNYAMLNADRIEKEVQVMILLRNYLMR